MKHMKQVLSLLLALILVLGLSVTAFAADEPDPPEFTITINSTTSGHTYEAYQIFTGDLYEETDTDGKTTKYLSNIVWGANVDTEKPVSGDNLIAAIQKITVDGSAPFAACTTARHVAEVLDNYYDTPDHAVTKAFADTVAKYLKQTTYVSGTPSSATVDGKTTYTYTITVPEVGYYLVKDKYNSDLTGYDAYTNYILEVIGDVNVTPKVFLPTVGKVVEKWDGSKAGFATSAAPGDILTYELVADLPANYADYSSYYVKFTDTMKNLTLQVGTLKVVVRETDQNGTATDTEVAASCYSVEGPTAGETGETVLTITIPNTNALKKANSTDESILVTKDSQIVVIYDAEIGDDIMVNGESATWNKVNLTYSNNPNNENDPEDPGYDPNTPPDPDEPDEKGTTPDNPDPGDNEDPTDPDKPTTQVNVFTFDLVIEKTNGASPLDGADFALYKYVRAEDATDEQKNATTTTPIETGEGEAKTTTGYWVKTDAPTIETEDGKTVDTPATEGEPPRIYNIFTFSSIAEGRYKLVETKTPRGYNSIDPVYFEIKATYAYDGVQGTAYVKTLAAAATNENGTPFTFEEDGVIKYDNAAQFTTVTDGEGRPTGVLKTDIVNKRGSILPSTGGIGTTIFYVVGTVLVLGAVVLLVARRRMRAEKE